MKRRYTMIRLRSHYARILLFALLTMPLGFSAGLDSAWAKSDGKWYPGWMCQEVKFDPTAPTYSQYQQGGGIGNRGPNPMHISCPIINDLPYDEADNTINYAHVYFTNRTNDFSVISCRVVARAGQESQSDGYASSGNSKGRLHIYGPIRATPHGTRIHYTLNCEVPPAKISYRFGRFKITTPSVIHSYYVVEHVE